MSPLLALFAILPPRLSMREARGEDGVQTGDPYVRLGRAIPQEEFRAAYAYLTDPSVRPPRFIPPGTVPLEAQRRIVGRYAAILGGLRQASDLPYRRDESLFANEDFSAVKDLARLALLDIHVRFADGDRHGAVTVILDAMNMSRRIRDGSTTGDLVGVACESMMLASVESHLDQISLPECDRLRAAADGVLAEKATLPVDASEPVRRAFANPDLWGTKEADPFLIALAKEATQMRLLRLHMRVEAYRWRYNRLPERLVDAAPALEVDDPLTRLPFRYEPEGLTYRLVSEGLPGLGPVALKYRRDPKMADPDATPTLVPPT